ncbi:UNVERIFIED_CONTAM: hypothetical protein NCL1_39933 [Trichonephila clavipes]
MALSKELPAIRNKKDLEIKFYYSQQRRDQEPTHFIYDLLKLHKQLELGKSQEALTRTTSPRISGGLKSSKHGSTIGGVV